MFLRLNEEKIGGEFRKTMEEGVVSLRPLYTETRTLAVAVGEMRNHQRDMFW